ncbi:MAG: hypothetical protein HYZ17_13425 [Betaproteobacteria bacterium]|nr:hypothetical protein [Betaproteobacteria bacterium]
MSGLGTFITWLVLLVRLVLRWPRALLARLLWPLVRLIELPFRLRDITLAAALALPRAILFLPARALGVRPQH